MEIFTCKHFFNMRALLRTIFFVCFSLPANTCFFLHTIYFRVYRVCKQFMSTFSIPPRQKKLVRPLSS